MDESLLELRTVVHEVGHTFLGAHGSPGADEGMMNPDIPYDGTDAENVFTPKSLGIIQSQSRPHSGVASTP